MRWLVSALVALTALPALAEPDWAAPFRKYVGAPAYLNEIGRAIAGAEERLAPHCVQVLKGMDRVALRIARPPEFIPGLPIPQGGQWQERVEIDRCGNPVLHNVLITAVKGESPFLTVLLPGTSKANGRLQLDASTAVFAIAGARAKQDCPDGARDIIDASFLTWLDETEVKPLPERRWREIWTARLCERTIPVQVDFTPDGKGGVTYRADLPQSRR